MKQRTNWQMRISHDLRGKITTGTKVESKTGKEIPKALDHFNIEKFPELINVYGEKPTRLFILMPSDNIEEFFQTEYSLWATSPSGNVFKKRECNGENCVHLIPEELLGTKYVAMEEHECFHCWEDDCVLPKESRCHCFTGFSAYVLSPETGKLLMPRPYRFQTNSVNSSDNLLSEMYRIFNMYSGLMMIPFILEVKMVEDMITDKNGKQTRRNYPIWQLQAYGTIDMLNKFREAKGLPTRDENRIMLLEAPVEDTPVKSLENPSKIPQESPENPPEKSRQNPPKIEEEQEMILEMEKHRDAWILTIRDRILEMVKDIPMETKVEEAKKILFNASKDFGVVGYETTKDLIKVPITEVEEIYTRIIKAHKEFVAKRDAGKQTEII